MRGTAGAAGDAGAAGIDSGHPRLRKPAVHTVAACACAYVSAIQGRDQRSGSSVTSLSNVHPPPSGPLSHGQAVPVPVPGQEDWSWESGLISSDPCFLALWSTHTRQFYLGCPILETYSELHSIPGVPRISLSHFLRMTSQRGQCLPQPGACQGPDQEQHAAQQRLGI